MLPIREQRVDPAAVGRRLEVTLIEVMNVRRSEIVGRNVLCVAHYSWVCERKDYGRSIPVDDIEEFEAKLDQIAGADKKGVIAATGP